METTIYLRSLRLLLVLAALLVPAAAIRAQEVQVAMDEADRLLVITADLARRLGLFTDVDGLREVLLFQLPDSSFVLEVTSATPQGRVRRERRPLSAPQALEFRRDVTTRIAERARSAGVDQSGRMKLVGGATLLGLFYYGWATAVALNPEETRASVAAYMVTAGSAFFVPYLLTRNRTVPDAVATMALWGATRGALHGALAADFVGDPSSETRFGWSVGVGAVETAIGGVAAHALSMTSGRAELTGAGGDLGLGIGWGIADLLKLNERYDSVTVPDGIGGTFTQEVPDRTAQQAVTLSGAALGLVGGYMLGGTDEWTRGDAVIFRNVALIAGLAGFAVGDVIQGPPTMTEQGGIYSYAEDGFTGTQTAAGLVGTVTGMVAGRMLVANRNFTTSQGTLLTLSPLAGGLLGLGIAYLATPEQAYDCVPDVPCENPNDHSELYLSASALGAAAGFVALYPAMARQSAKVVTAPGRLQFSLNPLAAARIFGGSRAPVTLGSVQFRF